MPAYDAILFLSFGGPEGMDDVLPFLANVLRGKNVPEARMREVAKHYEQFGGISPINDLNRQLIARLKEELSRRNIDLPIYWGNRNWHPLLPDAMREMRDAGVKRALCFVTSAYSSYSGCRQYLEDIQRAQVEVSGAPQVDKIRVFYNHPDFVEANAQNLAAGLDRFGDDEKPHVQVAFTAHSIPEAMAETCCYKEQLLETCKLVAQSPVVANKFAGYSLVFQSRSGPPSQPWLEPDILDHIRALHAGGTKHILVHPIGFISDHIEVLFDLDQQAQDLAAGLGLKLERSKTAGTNAIFIRMMGDLIEERIQSREGGARKAMGSDPAPDVCQTSCCAYVPARPPQKAPADR